MKIADLGIDLGKTPCSVADLAVAAAEFFDLSENDALMRVREIASLIANLWRPLLRQFGIGGEDLKSVADAFEHGEAEKALSL